MKQQQENRLTEGAIAPELLRFAVPFLFSSILQALYSAADLFVVGRYDTASAVSAVSIGAQVMQTVTGLVLGLSMGGTVLIGERVGEKNYSGAAKALGNLTVLFAGIAAVMTPVMLLLNHAVVSVMQTPTEAVEEARAYLRICSMGIPFIVGYNGVSCIFRGLGDSKTPVYFVMLACALNVGGDFLLVGGFGLGAAGAAAATIAAQGISFLVSLLYLWKKGFSFPVHRTDFRPQRVLLLRILRVGIPIAMQDFLANVSFLMITGIVNTLGVVASAGVGVAERLLNFAFLVPSSFSSAVATMSAQNYGAGRPDRAWKSFWYGVLFSASVGAVLCGVCNLIPETLTALFSTEQPVITAAGEYLRFYSVDCCLTGFIFCMNAYFSSSEQAVVAFLHSMVATFCVRIPLTLVLRNYSTESLILMGLAAPAASLVSILICSFVLVRVYRKKVAPYQRKLQNG